MIESPPSLLLEAQRLADMAKAHMPSHRKLRKGEDYWHFRLYQGGEPASTIDWRQTARCDDCYVREPELGVAQSILLWADRSPSMHQKPENAEFTTTERAHVLLLALAYQLLRNDEKIFWLGDDATPITSQAALAAMGTRFLPIRPVDADMPHPTLPSSSAIVVVASDFETNAALWPAQLRAMAAQGLSGILVMMGKNTQTNAPIEKAATNLGWSYLHAPASAGLHETLPALHRLLTVNPRLLGSGPN